MGGFFDFVKDIGSGVVKAATGGLVDLGTQYIGNELLGKPNAKDAWERQKNAAKLAYDRSMGAYKSRYQNTMADMRAAGLNPILAASGGFQVGQVSANPAQVNMAKVPDVSGTNSGLNLQNISNKNN
jgi:hypothetical protein